MALLFSSKNDDIEHWRKILNRELPDLDFRVWTPDRNNLGDPKDIEYVLAWRPKAGAFINLPNLKYIFSLGAGVDHLISKDLPKNIPIVRLMDPELTRGMSEYVIYWVLHQHRRMGEYLQNECETNWKQFSQTDTCVRHVGVMGLGVLGLDAAKKLNALGFKVSGWSRSPKKIDGISTFHGRTGFSDFLKVTEILVCLLPLTPATEGIINKGTLGKLPIGASIINPARGGHLIDNDLIQAINEGHISNATLDVFHTEPLPKNHPFWKHSKIRITPHIASLTAPETAALIVADNIRRIRLGQLPKPIVDLEAGY